MAISPFTMEEIAFEHPCFLVESDMVQRTTAGNCNDRHDSCKTRNWVLGAFPAVLALGLSACNTPMADQAPQSRQVIEKPLAPPVLGGWQAADPMDKDVQAAARYAAANIPKGQAVLAEVTHAETQVVAGLNIRMMLRLADGARWKAVVWRRLDGTFALTEAEEMP